MTQSSFLTATDSLETWLSYLEQRHFKPIDMGLARVRAVAEQFELLKPAPYVITVAGTNGKGSTCTLLERILLNAGLRVGGYSSPHLIRYNERVRIQGEMLPDSAHTASFALLDTQQDISLTYFEFSTLSALWLFKQAQLDVVILEVGLGGRLDATNIVDANLAIITSIDIDHVDFLGDNREAIGREKAGIFRPNIPVIIGEPDCPHSIIEVANTLHCSMQRCGVQWHYQVQAESWQWHNAEQQCHALPLPQIPLPNAATVLAAVHMLPFAIDENAIRHALRETQLTGRFQTLNGSDLQKTSKNRPLAQVIIDVGHNPHAARYLATRLAVLKQPHQRIFAVFSALADKDLGGIVTPLADCIDHWYCAGLDNYRGQSGAQVAQKLQQQLPKAHANTFDTIASAAQQALNDATPNDIVLVFGSFYVVAEFLQFIDPER